MQSICAKKIIRFCGYIHLLQAQVTPLLWHQPSRCTTLQTLYRRQPSFSGCHHQDLERIAGQSGLHNITFVLSAPSENILVPEILLIALQWT